MWRAYHGEMIAMFARLPFRRRGMRGYIMAAGCGEARSFEEGSGSCRQSLHLSCLLCLAHLCASSHGCVS